MCPRDWWTPTVDRMQGQRSKPRGEKRRFAAGSVSGLVLRESRRAAGLSAQALRRCVAFRAIGAPLASARPAPGRRSFAATERLRRPGICGGCAPSCAILSVAGLEPRHPLDGAPAGRKHQKLRHASQHDGEAFVRYESPLVRQADSRRSFGPRRIAERERCAGQTAETIVCGAHRVFSVLVLSP